MAEYLPPSENLPKFNEFVFNDAYSIKGLDARVVHKGGTETITGVKTFTNGVYCEGGISTPQVNNSTSGDLTIVADNTLALIGLGSTSMFSNTTTTISSTGIELITDTASIIQDTTKTVITNDNVGVVGNFTSKKYQVGTIPSNKPLSSMIMGVGHCQFALPNVPATSTVNTNGTWLGGSIYFRTPDYGVFIPTFITIIYSGTFTGGTNAIHRFDIVNNSTGATVIASTGNVAYTSGMNVATSASNQNFLSTGQFPAGNLFTVICSINTGASAITASTKVAYIQVYGYQTN